MVAVSLKKFFFQAEDGIRDHCVTGVQTCALPIYTTLQMFVLYKSAGRILIMKKICFCQLFIAINMATLWLNGLAVCPWDDVCKQISPCKNWWVCSTKCPLTVQSWLLLRCRVAVATLSYGGRHSIVWRSPHLFATPVELYEMACLYPSKTLEDRKSVV